MLTVYLAYALIISAITIYLAFIAYVKFTYPFWSRMKIQHSYNVWNRFYRIGIIDINPLERSKWTNNNNIRLIKSKTVTKSEKKEFVSFVRKHRLMNDNTINLVDRDNISSCLDYNNKLSFIGLYHEKHHKSLSNNPIIGIVSARPLSVRIKNKFFTTYMIDNLLADKERNKHAEEVLPQLIHTIIVEQQQINSARTCLFMREGELKIPARTLLSYPAYLFKTETWNSSKTLPASYQIMDINHNNVFIIKDAISKIPSFFKCSILPDWSGLVGMIKHKRIIVRGITYSGEIQCVYFMKDPCIMHCDKNIIECISTINMSSNIDIFVVGFNDVLVSIKQKYSNVIMHNVSHTNALLEAILSKHTPNDVIKNHLFLYNFIQPSMRNDECIIII